MVKKIEIFFTNKISIIILLLISLMTIMLSSKIYTYEQVLSLQDAVNYISLAENPKNYFTIPHQDALRIFPSIFIYFLKFTGLSTENCFKYLTFILFIYLHLKTFYLLKSYNIKNYLALSTIAILFYSNHSVIYTIFNYYQLLDLLTYILIIFFIQLNKEYDLKILFIISIISILTKEYLLILVCTTYFRYYLNYQNKKIIFSLIFILIIFMIHYKLASSYNLETKNSSNLLFLIKSFFGTYNLFIKSFIDGLIVEKNIFLFMPFSLLILSKKFLNNVINNYSITLFAIIPLGFSIFLFQHAGNNFFRVFYHGYFIILLLGILFLNKIIINDSISKIIFFVSPTFFIIDYIFILQNINQDGFFNFFQNTRYSYLSGYYIFNLIIFFIIIKNFRNIFLKN
jgi:hypothetical protein